MKMKRREGDVSVLLLISLSTSRCLFLSRDWKTSQLRSRVKRWCTHITYETTCGSRGYESCSLYFFTLIFSPKHLSRVHHVLVEEPLLAFILMLMKDRFSRRISLFYQRILVFYQFFFWRKKCVWLEGHFLCPFSLWNWETRICPLSGSCINHTISW